MHADKTNWSTHINGLIVTAGLRMPAAVLKKQYDPIENTDVNSRKRYRRGAAWLAIR